MPPRRPRAFAFVLGGAGSDDLLTRETDGWTVRAVTHTGVS